MSERIRVGLVGIGNCFSGLIQGIEYYRTNPDQQVIGIIHPKLAGYGIHDIDFVCGFDVGENKVGRTINEAIYAYPNMVNWIDADAMPKTDALVYESPALDGVGIWVANRIKPVQSGKTNEQLRDEILHILRETSTEIIVSYLPVGSDEATKFWAQICLDANVAFVNCIPSFIASDDAWAAKFRERNIPVIGDDIKGQVGATIVHRTLARLCNDRGTKITRTYQINVGGNTDFLNMKEQERLVSKKISKTESVQSQLDERLDDDDIYVGPSDFIPFLGNTKLMFMRIEGRQWANIPYNMEVRLDVDDKANSAGIVIDAVRLAKIALNRGVGGPIISASAYLMKHPIQQMSDPQARTACEEFVNI
ncbi:MAG: myo-inositol-1-phosphate synthase [Cenarchaeum sp. SB0665_bin_23]|nr:myo-inositol-1-phosphate synthase [Cenarchaeum sp. SB0667_bin_13]MXY60907.1 myo-inositol-1-phosphate synthase [Cenarchaeum sp. SB0665_bin_23]MXZ93349.1 myo-inositol-1-phosphate synthase [Cenarchaeum sp. SB0666_bin_15]MYB47606.1 myo-inositol-1-phosphate synthase [Cenarchaeum sp. SB0662_bin_33]MYC80367.1 myo-inositol-1-phosphate synthase [Cenarchaeum sp. SB0661_bin_35]MYD58362.1 myo-inositol-1-phosphate synthase [Cenarchaeum sp. SB0678_bin_8]MYG32503.1 myo-inositol-1-phosphate synthase [Cena